MTGTYSFHKASLADRDRLAAWHAQPHVRAWWGAAVPYDEDTLNDPRVARWIVSTNGRAFAYMQDYAVHGWENHHFAALPQGTRGIDQFIGEPDMTGQGHGTGFIATRLRILFEQGAPVVVTDPHPDNARAIAVYTKLGFKVFGPPQTTDWGLILPMRLDR